MKKNEVFCIQGLNSLNVQFRTCSSKPETFIRDYPTFRWNFECVVAIFRSKINIFVVFKFRDLELNKYLHGAQINLKIREKTPENIELLFYRPTHFIKTNFGICLAKKSQFFSNVVFFKVFSHCVFQRVPSTGWLSSNVWIGGKDSKFDVKGHFRSFLVLLHQNPPVCMNHGLY